MRIIIATDPPWMHTANAEQAKMLARSLMAAEHTVVWVPTFGFKDGTTSYDGITVRPGDDDGGKEIIRWHVKAIGADMVITRGDVADLGRFGGGDFRWIAWNPGEVEDKLVLRRAKASCPC